MVSETIQAVMLLTTRFPGEGKLLYTPLTPLEWGRFAQWQSSKGFTPASFFSEPLETIFSEFEDRKITRERVEYLLKRGTSLGLALEKWERSGLWVLGKGDSEYPIQLKKRLKEKAPPLLFGYGNKSILKTPSIAVVGSRNVGEDDKNFSRDVGRIAAAQGFSIVSGGARGADEASMLGALEFEGTAIGIMADSLTKASASLKYREHIMAGNLVLMSPYNPEGKFSVGNAMGRNKYIYCMSRAAVVVHSGLTGGTWTGANENLKNNWVPLFVKENNDPECGNSKLITLGAHRISGTINDFVFKEEIDKVNIPTTPEERNVTKAQAAEQLELFVSES